MCNEAARIEPYLLEFVPNRFKTQKMCDKVDCNKPYLSKFVPDNFQTQEIVLKKFRKTHGIWPMSLIP